MILDNIIRIMASEGTDITRNMGETYIDAVSITPSEEVFAASGRYELNVPKNYIEKPNAELDVPSRALYGAHFFEINNKKVIAATTTLHISKDGFHIPAALLLYYHMRENDLEQSDPDITTTYETDQAAVIAILANGIAGCCFVGVLPGEDPTVGIGAGLLLNVNLVDKPGIEPMPDNVRDIDGIFRKIDGVPKILLAQPAYHAMLEMAILAGAAYETSVFGTLMTN